MHALRTPHGEMRPDVPAGPSHFTLSGEMSSHKTMREPLAHWLFVGSVGIGLFGLALPRCADAFFVRWDLLFLLGLSWLLAAGSFLLKPSVPNGFVFFLGLLLIALAILR